MVPDTIERETVIDAPVERVWEVLTGLEHLGQWFGDAGAEGEMRPGGIVTLRWSDYGAHPLRIETMEPPHRFAYRWAPATRELVDGQMTLVEFTLTPDGDGTRLQVVESGFAGLDLPEDVRERTFGSNTGGWPHELGHLVEYIAKVAA
jgi:uncharacterized protein YndB with AHSA1/START domain